MLVLAGLSNRTGGLHAWCMTTKDCMGLAAWTPTEIEATMLHPGDDEDMTFWEQRGSRTDQRGQVAFFERQRTKEYSSPYTAGGAIAAGYLQETILQRMLLTDNTVGANIATRVIKRWDEAS
jgi:hypothetical protein